MGWLERWDERNQRCVDELMAHPEMGMSSGTRRAFTWTLASVIVTQIAVNSIRLFFGLDVLVVFVAAVGIALMLVSTVVLLSRHRADQRAGDGAARSAG
jgi:heme A synthase